jgi:hypothetical protein
VSDWRAPIQAHAEETYWTDYAEEGSEQPRRAIRWLLSPEGFGRVARGEACWNCLSGFPAPLGKAHLDRWHRSDFGFIAKWTEVRKLIRNEQCPLCRAECSKEMLAIQIDEARTTEEQRLYNASQLRLEDEREREDWAEQFLPREEIAPPSRHKSMKHRGET